MEGISDGVEVHFFDVFPDFIGQEIAHIFMFGDPFPDKGGGDGNQRGVHSGY